MGCTCRRRCVCLFVRLKKLVCMCVRACELERPVPEKEATVRRGIRRTSTRVVGCTNSRLRVLCVRVSISCVCERLRAGGPAHAGRSCRRCCCRCHFRFFFVPALGEFLASQLHLWIPIKTLTPAPPTLFPHLPVSPRTFACLLLASFRPPHLALSRTCPWCSISRSRCRSSLSTLLAVALSWFRRCDNQLAIRPRPESSMWHIPGSLSGALPVLLIVPGPCSHARFFASRSIKSCAGRARLTALGGTGSRTGHIQECRLRKEGSCEVYHGERSCGTDSVGDCGFVDRCWYGEAGAMRELAGWHRCRVWMRIGRGEGATPRIKLNSDGPGRLCSKGRSVRDKWTDGG